MLKKIINLDINTISLSQLVSCTSAAELLVTLNNLQLKLPGLRPPEVSAIKSGVYLKHIKGHSAASYALKPGLHLSDKAQVCDRVMAL